MPHYARDNTAKKVVSAEAVVSVLFFIILGLLADGLFSRSVCCIIVVFIGAV